MIEAVGRAYKTQVLVHLNDENGWDIKPMFSERDEDLVRYRMNNASQRERDDMILYCDKSGLAVAVKCRPQDIRKAKMLLISDEDKHLKKVIGECNKMIDNLNKMYASVMSCGDSGETIVRYKMRLEEDNTFTEEKETVLLDKDLPPMAVQREGTAIVGECYEQLKNDCEFEMRKMLAEDSQKMMAGLLKMVLEGEDPTTAITKCYGEEFVEKISKKRKPEGAKKK